MKTGNLILAARYAKALDRIAKNTDEAAHNLAELENCLKELKGLSNYLENPTVNEEVKISLIQKALPQNTARAFLLVLVKEKRFYLISEIIKELNNLLDLRRGIKRAQVISAGPLEDNVKNRIQKFLEDYFNSKLALEFKEDKGLISGVKIKAGDFYIEDSAASRLRELAGILRE